VLDGLIAWDLVVVKDYHIPTIHVELSRQKSQTLTLLTLMVYLDSLPTGFTSAASLVPEKFRRAGLPNTLRCNHTLPHVLGVAVSGTSREVNPLKPTGDDCTKSESSVH
jgi:hypothetical protein